MSDLSKFVQRRNPKVVVDHDLTSNSTGSSIERFKFWWEVPPDLNSFWEYHFYEALWTYSPPILIIAGTILNALTVIVLLKRKFGKSSTRILLIVLAFVDTGVLWTALLGYWIRYAFDVEVRILSELSCPLNFFFTYFFLQLASWSITLLTIERWISVIFPLKAKLICTGKRTAIILILVVILLLCLNAHMLFLFGIRDGECLPMAAPYIYFWKYVWTYIDLLAKACIPFLVITVCNCSILYKVIRSHNTRKKLPNLEKSSDGQTAHAQMTSMTYMLTTVSVMFIFLTLPACIYYILILKLTLISSWHSLVKLIFIHAFTNFIQYINNSINFLLYCVSGKQFRTELYQMFKGTPSRAPSAAIRNK
ncbi:FMRFamide peptide receptor frpr-18-like [Lineus longissimus]|uniref:FMRFamide peptide receptor frpr-18-like n=1 Tax=Lineus longissimus TaxID=88925 RepID=UPI00315CC44D